MNTPMSLYKMSLLAIIKNENLQVDDLPKIILAEVKQLQSLQTSWNDQKVRYNRHFSAIKALAELTWEAKNLL